ncbi:MAG: LacI family DNA-binding transcriptional regulator [Armatimonadota bacterium]
MTQTIRKPTTLQDVAGALGMHKSTVSLALSGKGTISADTRRRVLTVAQELGYEPNLLAQRLAHGQGTTMVCIFSGVLDVGLATEKILLVQKALGGHSLEVPIYTCYDSAGGDIGETQAAQVRQLCRQRPRAIICAAQRVHPAVFRELGTYQQNGGIVVSYDAPVPLLCDQVIFDREDNAYQAARHLLEQGHRRIGIGMSQVGAAADAQPGLTTSDPQNYRMRGFRRALAEFGVPFRDEWFFKNATYEKGGAEMARQFLSLRERPTALAIVNDYVALAFMVEVMRAGVRIPHDLSLVGHDNQPIAAYCPVPLTSTTQPADRVAEAVVDVLLSRVSDSSAEASPRTVTITGKLVRRESVASPVS